jgi:hypothetical protein
MLNYIYGRPVCLTIQNILVQPITVYDYPHNQPVLEWFFKNMSDFGLRFRFISMYGEGLETALDANTKWCEPWCFTGPKSMTRAPVDDLGQGH